MHSLPQAPSLGQHLMIPVDTSSKKHRNTNNTDTKGHVYDVTNVVNSPMTLYKIQQAGMGSLPSSVRLPSTVTMTTLTTPALLTSIINRAIYYRDESNHGRQP